MMVAGMLAGLAFSSDGTEPLFERIAPQVAAERVSQCGLGEVAIRFDEELQSDVLTATEAIRVSDEGLACADRAAGYYDLELPPAIQPRYDAIRDLRLSASLLKQAQAWLAERGLLERVPSYQEGVTDDKTFARRLERLCGPHAEGAFQSGYGSRAIGPAWIQRSFERFEEDVEALDCLMNAARVAGFAIGFIGNEAGLDED